MALRIIAVSIAPLTLLLAGCAAGPQPPAAPVSPPDAADCRAAPLDTPLYLRGAMTTWTLREDYAFRWVCNAYLLNVDLHGRYAFRITDERFDGGTNWGAAPGSAAPVRDMPMSLATAARHSGNIEFDFDGAYTLRLVPDAVRPTLTIGAQTYRDPDAAPIEDALARSLAFDSRDTADKTPFGAVVAGGTVEFALRAAPGVDAVDLVVERRRLEGPQETLAYAPIARVPLTRAPDAAAERWRGSYCFDTIGVYGYWFDVRVGVQHFVYGNNADPIYWTRELGSNGRGDVVRGDTAPRALRRFRQTVYRGDFQVPDWARDSVYYYIFPERFRNGDTRNDPKAGPGTFHDGSVEVHANWNETPWRPHSGDGSDERYGNDFFGGDLAGIAQKLDYIRDLGANTLYLTPIFSAASNHKYDTADYRHVDPHFGTDAEFEALAKAAKARGIRIVLDTSLNHSGSDSIYFDRWGKWPGVGAFENGVVRRDSPYADWYKFSAPADDPSAAYRGWMGAPDLPELNKSAPSYRDFAYRAPGSIMKLWLDRGASGWRMDVAPWVPDDFWREWRSAVKGHRADALAVCETQFESSKFLLGDEFDSTMNYVFRDAVGAYANGGDARAIYSNIELMRETYPPQAFYALMNLLSTHDSPRALFDFGWRDVQASADTIALAKRRLRFAALFQMTFPGAPAVFYGDEVGVTGGEDPYNRVTYPWADRGGKPDRALLDAYKRLIRLRHELPVLRHGSIDAPLFLDAHTIVLLRHNGAHWAVTAFNNDAAPHNVRIALPAELRGATFTDALAPGTHRVQDGSLAFDIGALDGRVLTTTTTTTR